MKGLIFTVQNAIALGTFDGVHSGHQPVLDLPKDFHSIAVTFREPPKAVISGNLQMLMSIDDKYTALKDYGIDEIVLLNFNDVKNIEPNDFLNLLLDKYSPALISCGYNYRFGKSASGDIAILADFCKKNDIVFKCCDNICIDGISISSTYIRSLISNGEIEKANNLLYNRFGFSAEVIDGEKRGRTIDFPTINQAYPKYLASVKFGVYKSMISFDGNEYEGITNIGIRPTYKSDYVISETFIKNFSGNIYGKIVKTELIKFIRAEKKFNSLEELKNQIVIDLKN